IVLGSQNPDGSLPVTINGNRFLSVAEVSWQTPGGAYAGPDIPGSVTPNTIALNKNFASLVGTWQVRVSNPDGTKSAWYSLAVSGQTLLPSPVLISPANSATGVPSAPPFTWGAVSGATNYWLMVAT